MTRPFRITILTITALLIFTSGVTPVSAYAAEDPLIRAPWLRNHLSDDALAYMRIPNIYGLFASPKGSSLDRALGSEANIRSVRNIRRGISDNIIPLIPAFDDPMLQLLERHLESPIEIAVVAGQTPSAIVSLNLDLRSNAAVDEMFSLMLASDSGIGLVAPLDDSGIGQIQAGGIPAYIQFHKATGRVFVNAGPAVTMESFVALLETVGSNDDHKMRAMEQRVDASGQGFFQWVDVARAVPMMQMMMQPEASAELVELGLDKVTAAAVGWGVANGKGRLSIIADLRADGDRGLLPNIENKVTARSVGDPDGVLLLSIPSAAEFSRIETMILNASEIDEQAEWLKTKSDMLDEYGFSFEELLSAIGPDVLFIFDTAGDYGAVRVRNKARWKLFVDKLAAKSGTKPQAKRIGSKTYYQWSVPASFDSADQLIADKTPWLAELLGRRHEHAFWTQDGDYLYVASVPQILIDRAALRPRTNVGSWLAETQRIDTQSAFLSVSGTSHKLPGRLYATYIEVLQFLADIGQAEFDIWSMPTAGQLKLPETGTLGFTISLGDPTLAAEFTFENNPGELLGSVTGVAMAGVLAAIAIPAYQDYTIRAKVSEGLNLSGAQKAAVAEYYMSNGRFPGLDAAAEMSTPDEAGQYTRSVIVEPETGRVLVDFRVDEVPGGGQIFLQPTGSNGYIEWQCDSTIADKHVPAACRANSTEE